MTDLTIGKESRLIWRFTLPMLAGNLFQQLYNVVDSVIVGQVLGKEALTAIGNCFPVIFTLISLTVGVAIGGTVVISQYFGAKDMDRLQKAVDTLFIFLFWMGLFLSLAGFVFSETLLRWLKTPEASLPMAVSYLRIYVSGLLAFFGYNWVSAILRGLGDSKTPLYFLIFSTLLNISLDILFVWVFGWGIAGASWATVISQAAAFVASVMYINRRHSFLQFRFKALAYDRDILMKSIKIGLPTGFQQTFVSLGMMALISIVNTFGMDVAAAYSVAGRIDSLAMLPAMNFSAALSTFVGQNLGANKIDRVRTGLKATLVMSSSVSLGISVLVVAGGSLLMRMFTADSEVIRIGHEYLIIVGSFYLFFNAMFTISGVMRGAGDTLIPMFLTLFSLWVIRIPLAIFLSKHIGEHGVWWAIPIAWCTGMIFSYIYYLTGRWKTKVIVKHIPV